MITVQRIPATLHPDRGRVLIRPFLLTDAERVRSISGRLLALDDETVSATLRQVIAEFADRHIDIEKIFRRHFSRARAHLSPDCKLSPERELLLGSYFTSEYALESAALFNPSIVAAPDQTGVPKGSLRFILSLRATGEGHLSSIEFRSGLIGADGTVSYDELTPFVTEPQPLENAAYEKKLFLRKLGELGFDPEECRKALAALGAEFTLAELEAELLGPDGTAREAHRLRESAVILARSNYETRFDPRQPVSARAIFPVSPSERNGIEDARFVQFREDGRKTYVATYTAYDGQVIYPQMIETDDFLHFKVSTLNGPAAQNKGMALFPRKVNGLYAMISRQDNENLFIMFSDHLHFWYERELLLQPEQPWELVQLGNCGSPIETEAGWLLLTHGVGPMRKYCIGAILLDLDDPRRIIGRLREPLLTPNDNEREGYVPNVVYTCGAIVHRGQLIMPYAMSDYASTVASVPLDELLSHLT